MGAAVVSVNEVLDGHVALELQCADRLLLTAYVPTLQSSGQVAWFLHQHLGNPIPSPATFDRIGNRFRRDVKAYAAANRIPILELKKPDRSRWDDRKLDHVRPYLDAAERDGRFGVVAIVHAQEYQWVSKANEHNDGRGVWFEFIRAERRVGVYYFYIYDTDFGAGFIKLCTYFPYPGKVWVNGHEWAKRQADYAGIGYTALANGFATCDDPDALQAICDRFGPDDIQGFFDRWIDVIPTPFTPDDRAAGFWWDLSMREIEVSRTVVFDDPRRARGFFEALVVDNIDIGRPDRVNAVFGLPRSSRRRKQPHQTRVFTTGTNVSIDFRFKHSRVKQYLKEGRALRIETVINKPRDIGVRARLEHLPELVVKARAINDRLLRIERAGQGCAIGSALFERIHQPYIHQGQRTGALRFGDPRAMALTGALCVFIHVLAGFTNHSLRGLVAGLLGRDYTTSQMTYDLRRLRLHGLIQRIPKTHSYVLTPDGVRVAVFYNKIHSRLLRPLIAAGDQPPAPVELRRALGTINRIIDNYADNARLARAA